MFNLPIVGVRVKREKVLKEYMDMMGDTVVVTDEMRKFMFENHGVVKIEEAVQNLDQNDFGVKWKLVHMAFNKVL